MEKRIFGFAVISLIISFILIVRLAQIQLFDTESYSKYNINLIEESINQRTQSFVLHKGRGYFTDRHGESLNHTFQSSLILFPFLKEQVWPVDEVATIIGTDKEHIELELSKATEPIIYSKDHYPVSLNQNQMKQINELKIPGVYAQYVDFRYKDPIAHHLIGVTGENEHEVMKRYPERLEKGMISRHTEIGVSGLQRAFDPFLLSAGESKLSYHVDGKGNPLFGYGVKYTAPANPYYPTEVITTIDKEIQRMAEKVITDAGITKGGVVILDVESNDLLALVSRPMPNLNNPFGAGGKNEMISAQFPGSIFKLVVAAAAIEENLIEPNQLFNCNQNLYNDGEEERQLGNLSFVESFAQSCNYTFASLAIQLLEKDSNSLDTYAQRLGLGNYVGWEGAVYHIPSIKHFPEEEIGRIWLDEGDKKDSRSIAQTAIGQRNVQISPLAIANMITTIARGGEKYKVRASSKINYENGTTLVEFEKKKIEGNKLAPYTVMKLQKMLKEVVSSEVGTGHYLNELPYSVVGKSGTAEKADKNFMNQWFAGYFPANKPKYAMVVVDLNRQPGQMKTYKAYKELVTKLYEFDNKTGND